MLTVLSQTKTAVSLKIRGAFHIRPNIPEGREGVKWELGFAFFRGWEMGFCALGLGFMKRKTIEKWEWDFNLSNTGWDCGI